MSEFKCRICGEKHYVSLFQFAIPLVADVKDKPVSCEKYCLEPVVCEECGHVQLIETLDINMYSDYLYTPSFSKEFQEYIMMFAEELTNKLGGYEGKRIVEIGSSNGYLLKQMKSRGWDVLGFEPSSVLASEARKNGVHTEEIYFGSDASIGVMKEWGTANVIVMRHVMEHLDDINGIVKVISDMLDDGFLVIEVPWLLRIIREKQFYAFFHEHLSYFSISILNNLLQKYGFTVIDVRENNLEGGSIAVYAHKGRNLQYNSSRINTFLEMEKKWCCMDQLIAFSTEMKHQIAKIKDLVAAEKKSGKKVAVWGAGQRGVTLLNICGLTNLDIEYIVDVNENYWWKYVLGVDIQIVPPSYLEEHFVDSIVILATGYADEIISVNNEYLNRGGRFIKIVE